MKKRMTAWALLLCLTLSGCASLLPPKQYTLRFYDGETLIAEQTVAAGELPETVEPEQTEGLRFVGWDRAIEPAAEDTEYRAQYAPALECHVPFLFPMADGLLRPDWAFTGKMLTEAIQALTPDSVSAMLPELPSSEKTVTMEQLRTVLEVFYPDAEQPLFKGFRADKTLTRSDAAVLLNSLLGRTDELVAPEMGIHSFPDVRPDRPDYSALMEAAAAHTAGHRVWKKLHLTTGLEPGWNVCLGKLRMIDDGGYLMTDTVIENKFTIGADGYYTSGNEQLDGYITELLASFQEEAPEADRMALLRMAYDYTRDSFTYLRRNPYYEGYTGWEIQDAVDMLYSGFGNCYSYAAVFAAFARNLGYDARPVSGKIKERPHGWVIIKIDGKKYYSDPELEMGEMLQGHTHWDLFLRPPAHSGGWDYVEPWFPN